MARVLCQCGQSFTPFLINGVPRSHCPYCRRSLSIEKEGERQLSVEAPSPSSVRDSPTLPPTPRFVAPSPQSDPTSQSVEALRLGSPRLVERALEELKSFLLRKTQKKAISSVHQELDTSNRSEYALRWTMITVGAIILLEGIIFAIVSAILRADPDAHPPNYLHLMVFAVGLPMVGGIVAYLVASRESNRQEAEMSSMKEAARQMGLHYLPLIQIPEAMTDGFPVICPTPPVYGWHVSAERCRVTVFGTGDIHGQSLHLAQFEFHFDQHDHMPLGGMVKALQTIVKPSTAFARPEIWQMYLLAIFPDALAHTSDFLITPNNRDFAATYIHREFGQHLVPLPNYGELCNYMLVSPSREDAYSLLGKEFLNLLSCENGWSIQLVAGRLMIWRGVYYPAFRFWSSMSPETITELVHFSIKVRQILVGHDTERRHLRDEKK